MYAHVFGYNRHGVDHLFGVKQLPADQHLAGFPYLAALLVASPVPSRYLRDCVVRGPCLLIGDDLAAFRCSSLQGGRQMGELVSVKSGYVRLEGHDDVRFGPFGRGNLHLVPFRGTCNASLSVAAGAIARVGSTQLGLEVQIVALGDPIEPAARADAPELAGTEPAVDGGFADIQNRERFARRSIHGDSVPFGNDGHAMAKNEGGVVPCHLLRGTSGHL